MNRMSRIVLALALLGAVCSPRPLWAQSSLWDSVYNSDVLPTSPLLGDTAWLPHWGNSNSDLSTAGGILQILTQTPGSAWFTQPSEGYSVSGPLTVECRVRVVAAEPQWPYSFAVAIGATNGARGFIGLFSDRIAFFTDDTTTASYPVDMTTFRVIRIAVTGDPDRYVSVGLDGLEVFYGPLRIHPGSGNAIGFGSMAASETYWDYVAFSNAYLPVPEPSSLLALTGGLGLLAGRMRRRRG